MLFCGHGDERGFSFPTQQKYGLLAFGQEPRWGNGDLRWLILNACSVLSVESLYGDWASRWGRAFAGLRLMLGFTNITGNLPGVGAAMAEKALGGHTLVNAWLSTSIAIQESDVRWAAMGVIDQDGIAHWDDRLETADLSEPAPHRGAAAFRGYWLFHGSS